LPVVHRRTRLSHFQARISAVILSGSVVITATAVFAPTPVYGASVTKAAACATNLRTRPYVTARRKTTIKTNTRVTVTSSVTGGRWRVTCAGKTRSGRSWYRISAINGKSVKRLYGVTYVYAATGLFKSVVTTPTATAVPLTPTLAFDAECGGSGVDPRFKALFGPGDPGDRLDTDTMGDLRQVSVQNGMCTINVERKTTPSGRPFAGAAMATYGTFGQKYGTFETRLRYAEAKGTWPSFFLLPVGQKGPYPEIDVFEAYGDTACEGPGFLTSSLSTSSTVNKWKAWIPVSAPSDGWHVHKIVWTASKIEFYIDDVMTFSSTTVISQVAMYPILIFGVGANNPGCRADATTPSKLTMDVDYLRVYAP